MPRGTRQNEGQQSNAVVPATPDTSALMANLPDDVREDLLRAQRAQIGERQRLPQVKIVPAGAGLFEFADTHETTREFAGVILGSHARNVLWDKPFGSTRGEDEAPIPACASNDGRFGVPRQGFAHAALQPRDHTGVPIVATGTERIACRTCPYNAWGSKRLIPELMRPGDSGKGKAVVNQRAVYVLVEGRATPVELVLPPTSLTAFDEYLATLLNRGIPVQAIYTVFSQERQSRNGVTWAQATFSPGDPLGQDAFSLVLARRSEWRSTIDGVEEELVAYDTPEPMAPAAGDQGSTGGDTGDEVEDDHIPF